MQSPTIKRIIRRLMALLPKTLLSSHFSWRWLACYPSVTVTNTLLQKWNHSHWEEYQSWLEKHSLQDHRIWMQLSKQAKRWQNPPRFSIVVPVYNSLPEVLYEAILSVRAQTYPFWQLILVDDASTRAETLVLLRSSVCRDPRIRVLYNSKSLGISGATNRGISKATGDYVVFLDHDDRLSLEALSLLASAIAENPALEILYSDRDMISEDGERYLHVFKPDWSPESLLSGNYLFHLMCYKRELLQRLGGLRSDYDGSQDYDLILRAAETHPRVCHIPKILYHWRQHPASVALNVDSKEYAFKAGINALNAALKRRNSKGFAQEIPGFWRGTYQINGLRVNKEDLQIIQLNPLEVAHYADRLKNAIDSSTQPYIVILGTDILPETDDTLNSLAAWLAFEQVGLATGKILDRQNQLDYVGMAYKRDASLIYPYRGFAHNEPGYLGVVQLVRNISAPHPYCVVIRRSLWVALGGFRTDLTGPYALLDFALRALQHDWRTVIVPQCRFENLGKAFYGEAFEYDQRQFQSIWQNWLANGDPYYNGNLAENSRDMGLDI